MNATYADMEDGLQCFDKAQYDAQNASDTAQLAFNIAENASQVCSTLLLHFMGCFMDRFISFIASVPVRNSRFSAVLLGTSSFSLPKSIFDFSANSLRLRILFREGTESPQLLFLAETA